jgi:uncharacterized protein with FMN-binding domain
MDFERLDGRRKYMKKPLILVVITLVLSIFYGCANRNTSYMNQNQSINQGTTQGTRTNYEINSVNKSKIQYKDGIYTAEGIDNINGNQAATVVVKGGRITDITLISIDQQGNEISSNTLNGNASVGKAAGTESNTANTPGNTTGNAGYITGDYSFQNIGGDAGGMIGGTVDGVSGRTNTGTISSVSNYDSIRKQIASSMVRQQTSEVALYESDSSITQNWKLAVRRALEKAR